MNVVIVGCGRVGATLAADLDANQHKVTIIDLSTRAFDRLPATFAGDAVRGDGTDEDTLRRAGAQTADVFLALTEGDNRNVMAAQLAAEVLGIGRVVAKINDQVRADAYADLGIATLCRTDLMTNALLSHLGLDGGPMPGVRAAVPHHHEVDELEGPPVESGSASVGSLPTREA
jgi:trk system potassium uptake protein TrkA